MQHIAFNKQYILELAKKEYDFVYLICKTGNRSDRVKKHYFNNVTNIISLDGGISNIKIFPDVVIILDKGGFGKAQYMQLITLIILAFFIYLNYKGWYSLDMMVVTSIFFIMLLIIFISRWCFLNTVIPLFNPSV